MLDPYRSGAGRRRALVAGPVLAALLLGSAACSSHDAGEESGKSSSKPAAKTSNTEAAQKKAVRNAYEHSWDEQVKAYAHASSKGTKLQTYTQLNALSRIEGELLALKDADQVVTGKPKLQPKVAAVRPGGKVPKASVTDCVDVSEWRIVDEKSKKPASLPEGRLKKAVHVAELERWGEQWKVVKLEAQNRGC